MSVSRVDAIMDQLVDQLEAYQGGALRTLLGDAPTTPCFDAVARVDMATQEEWDVARTDPAGPDVIAMVELPNIADQVLNTGLREKVLDVNIFAARRVTRVDTFKAFDPRGDAARAAEAQRQQIILALAYDVERALTLTPDLFTLEHQITTQEMAGRNLWFYVNNWDALQIVMRLTFQHVRGDS